MKTISTQIQEPQNTAQKDMKKSTSRAQDNQITLNR